MDQAVTSESAPAQTGTSTPYIFSDWYPWYQGIERAVGTADLAFGVVPPVARKQYVNALRIDLTSSGVSFYTTPKAPEGSPCQTIGNTVTGFLSAEPAVMVAINANFSWYDTDVCGGNFSLMGLAVSQGNVVCDPTRPAPRPGYLPPTQSADVPDVTYVGAAAMLISQDNAVTFSVVTEENNPDGPPDAYTAIAGSPQPPAPPSPDDGWPPQQQVQGPLFLVQDGANQARPEESPAEEIAGRTGVGLSADTRYLYLVTLDGFENAAWPYGGGFYDIAQWLVIAGASTGINLDGGGSTSMACSDSSIGPVLMNIPFGNEATAGYQRAVGNFFGVMAQRLS
jgi:Phosphodiester glycosidase